MRLEAGDAHKRARVALEGVQGGGHERGAGLHKDARTVGGQARKLRVAHEPVHYDLYAAAGVITREAFEVPGVSMGVLWAPLLGQVDPAAEPVTHRAFKVHASEAVRCLSNFNRVFGEGAGSPRVNWL